MDSRTRRFNAMFLRHSVVQDADGRLMLLILCREKFNVAIVGRIGRFGERAGFANDQILYKIPKF